MTFSYFSPIHIETFVVSTLICIFLFYIPRIFKNVNIEKYSTILGYFLLIFKIIDSIYRLMYQNEPITNVMPIHLCNFAAIFAGLYLIFRTKFLYNAVYYLTFGPVLALILPGIIYYHDNYYVYIFMIMHALIVFTVFFGSAYLGGKTTKKGLIQSIITLLLIFLYAFTYNFIFKGINAMFLRTHIISQASFIKPIWLYDIVLILTMIFLQFLLYLPIKKENK
ncbi:Integral membrane protein (intg_mem_TP0381) [uncultured Leptotrichia sp.]|uniref:YwaF family protein n=1 Tax=uncultured Leptotrichia sp. TaxID=159271 RepID=UPI001A535C2B|nr:TIGR02206 family membrane protein [uncultured Leptotrichia sp.]VTX53385.1 Integral membrane protein (intg_mem_TP0381) [uncultured Leptotrichia sp.]